MTEKQLFNNLYNKLTYNNHLIHTSALLSRAAAMYPNNDAVICDEESITYAHLYASACLFAEKLAQHGVTTGDRVLLFYENSLEFYIAYFGVWQLGAVVAPLNVFLSEAEFMHIVGDATPKAIVISPTLKNKLSQENIVQLPTLLEQQDILKTTITTEITKIPTRDYHTFTDDTISALLYTSGTTGFPKGVMLSSRNIITNTLQAIARLGASDKDRVYCALPLFHSLPQNTCMWSTLVVGACAIIVPKIERRSLLNGFKHKPTVVVAVPALYGLFVLLKTIDFSTVRFFFSGGDALSDKVRSAFKLVYQRTICNGYGLTETSPFIAVDIDDFIKPTSNVGEPLIGLYCTIRDEHNNSLPAYHIGTLWVKGDNIMLGYYNAPEATDAVLQDGWLNTGDLAYLDAYGKIVLSGRERELISQKGLKIYPQEVENILLSHSAVMQAAVIGFAQGNEGEIALAFIGTKASDHKALIEDLRNLCLQNLAPYKVPREFIIKSELPVNPTGKVDKKSLKAELTEQSFTL